MSDIKDHDPDEGEWISPFDLIVGKIEVVDARPTPTLRDLIILLWEIEDSKDDNPNIIRGYN